jgi:signal transduction histidine kinase
MQHILKLESIDVREEIEQLLGDLSQPISDAGADIVEEAPPNLKVNADRAQFMRLMANLIENAIKFHRPEKTRNHPFRGLRAGAGCWALGRRQGNRVRTKICGNDFRAVFETAILRAGAGTQHRARGGQVHLRASRMERQGRVRAGAGNGFPHRHSGRAN